MNKRRIIGLVIFIIFLILCILVYFFILNPSINEQTAISICDDYIRNILELRKRQWTPNTDVNINFKANNAFYMNRVWTMTYSILDTGDNKYHQVRCELRRNGEIYSLSWDGKRL